MSNTFQRCDTCGQHNTLAWCDNCGRQLPQDEPRSEVRMIINSRPVFKDYCAECLSLPVVLVPPTSNSAAE